MKDLLQKIKSKSIAIVYTYKNEMAQGFEHYDYWGMNVVSDWAKAIEELSCIPYIVDVRTFGYKALNNTLPPIDFVINLNAGNSCISTLGLVPSICSFLGIPCIPNNTLQIVTGEHKEFSNLIVKSLGIKVPKKIDKNNNTGIFRPMNLGSSIGVKRGIEIESGRKGLYQEFIQGFDMTTPILFNPLTKELETLPPIAYIPQNNDINWFLGEREKESHNGYIKQSASLSHDSQELFIKIAKTYEVKTLCRIDTRIRCDNSYEMYKLIENTIPIEKIFFLEINMMPTITERINFCNSIENLSPNINIFESLTYYKKNIPNHSITGFILFCSIAALIK